MARPTGSLRQRSRQTSRIRPSIYYDELVGAYRDHRASFEAPPDVPSPVLSNLLARHFVVLNGRVIGGWRNTVGKSEVGVETRLLVDLSGEQEAALHTAAADYGRFLDMVVAVHPQPRLSGANSAGL